MNVLHSQNKTIKFEHLIGRVINVVPQIDFTGRLTGKLILTILTKDGSRHAEEVDPKLEVEVVVDRDVDLAFRHQVAVNFSGLVNKKGFKVGSDPEIFVVDGENKMIPAYKFLGSKAQPNKGDAVSYGSNAIYWDGFQAEFTTSAESCLSWQCDSVQVGMRSLLKLAKAYNPSAKLSHISTMDVDLTELMTAADEHVTFGCMPSKNAYGMKGVSLDGRDVAFRSAGGHIHFGIGQLAEETMVSIVKSLDSILGVACVSLFAGYDDPRRRTMYGLAGEYRTPPHGLEYRVLSNAWMIHPLLMNMVFELSRVSLYVGKLDIGKLWKASEEEVIKCINTCDVTMAREILKRNSMMFLRLLDAAHLGPQAYSIFMEGLDSVIAAPNDLTRNWNLESTWTTHCDGVGKSWRYAQSIICNKGKVG